MDRHRRLGKNKYAIDYCQVNNEAFVETIPTDRVKQPVKLAATTPSGNKWFLSSCNDTCLFTWEYTVALYKIRIAYIERKKTFKNILHSNHSLERRIVTFLICFSRVSSTRPRFHSTL